MQSARSDDRAFSFAGGAPLEWRVPGARLFSPAWTSSSDRRARPSASTPTACCARPSRRTCSGSGARFRRTTTSVYVANEAGRIVGVAATERRDTGLYLDRLAVDPAKQGTGLGSWLLLRLEEVARSRGDRAMSLQTAEMMEHLLRLYGRHGFEIVSRGPPDHGKDPHTRVTMVKLL